MADLSQVKNRITRQDIPTRNRDSVIDPRRNTEAPTRQSFADMRNASRGDGGAAQLMEALGLVQKAAGDVQTATNNQYAAREDKLGSQGTFDEAAGHADPELVRKSIAYRGSVMTQRAQTSFYQNAEKLDDTIKGIVNSDDPHLLDPANRALAIEHAIDQNFKQFAVDPETNKLRDWGSPTAAKWLGQQMGAARAEVRAKALQMVEERSNELSIQQAAETFGASIDAGKPMGFEDAMSGVLPTADKRKAKEQLILVAKDKAASLAEKAAELDETDPTEAKALRIRALGLVDTLRGSKRIDPKTGQPAIDATKPYYTEAAPAAKLDPQEFFKNFVAVHEGSKMVTDSNGAKVKYGINAEFNPGVDIAGLTLGKAADHFEANQWKRSGADKLPPALAAVHADTFFLNEKKAGEILKAANGDVGKYIELRRTFLNGLATKNPAKFGKYKDGWEKRTSDLAAYAAKLGGGVSGPAVDASVLSPQSPSDAAAADPAGASNPLYSLNAQERAEIGAFRRQLKSDIDRADEAATTKRQSTTAMDYMARLHGMGAYPTPGEIQTATREGKIGVAHAVQLLGVIEQDEHQRETDAREVRSEARADKAQAREDRVDTVDGYVNGILGKLYSGKYRRGAADAEAELRTLLPSIADSDVRQAVFAGVVQGTKAHTDLRNATPEYRTAMNHFDEWEATYVSQLTKRRIRKDDKPVAEVLIKQWVNEYRVRLSQYAALPPEKVQGFMDRAERDLDGMIDRRFPASASRARH